MRLLPSIGLGVPTLNCKKRKNFRRWKRTGSPLTVGTERSILGSDCSIEAARAKVQHNVKKKRRKSEGRERENKTEYTYLKNVHTCHFLRLDTTQDRVESLHYPVKCHLTIVLVARESIISRIIDALPYISPQYGVNISIFRMYVFEEWNIRKIKLFFTPTCI